MLICLNDLFACSGLAQTRKLLTNFSKNSCYLLPEPLRLGEFLTNYCMKANKRNRIVKVRLTNLEYEELTKASKSSKCMSDYFRQRVFRKGVGLIDPKEFIRSMDEICLEMKRIGNNINQLARYVNIHKEEVNQEVLNEVEKKMADYVIMQDKLNVTWRKLMSIK